MATLVFCEDEALIRRMIGVMLRDSGHDLHFALDGEQGLALVERERPAALFTDRWMPNLDGFQLCAAVKANPALAHIPVVLISASLQPDERDEVLRKGFAAILHKPFGPADLRALVNQIVPTAERP
jgi:CheY-like chemotaxis protein